MYVERGVIATFGQRVVALGAPTFFWLDRAQLVPPSLTTATPAMLDSLVRTGAFVEPTGTAAGVPKIDTVRTRRTPRLLGWSDRQMRIMWSAADSAMSPASFDRGTRVDIATFDGERWSAAETVLRGTHTFLAPPPAMRAGMTFDLDAVAVAVKDSSEHLIRLARRVDGKWSTSDWRAGTLVIDAMAAPTADGSTVVIAMTRVNDITGVYAIRMDRRVGASASWLPPVLVDSLSRSFGYLSAERLGGDSLVVVWEQRAVGVAAEGLMTAVSADGGRSWARVPPLVTESADGQQLAVDAAGQLHVVFRAASQPGALNSPGAIMHSIWQSGHWTEPILLLSDGASMTAPALGFAPGGRLMVMWTDATWGPQGPMPKSFASTWTPNGRGR